MLLTRTMSDPNKLPAIRSVLQTRSSCAYSATTAQTSDENGREPSSAEKQRLVHDRHVVSSHLVNHILPGFRHFFHLDMVP